MSSHKDAPTSVEDVPASSSPGRTVETAPPRRGSTLRQIVVIALVVMAAWVGYGYYQSRTASTSGPHTASALVKVISTEETPEGVEVKARLDAPSPRGTSHVLTGVIPNQTWALTHVVWACYPPSNPDQGILRSPLDPDCASLGN